jgi:hypothetical protein
MEFGGIVFGDIMIFGSCELELMDFLGIIPPSLSSSPHFLFYLFRLIVK